VHAGPPLLSRVQPVALHFPSRNTTDASDTDTMGGSRRGSAATMAQFSSANSGTVVATRADGVRRMAVRELAAATSAPDDDLEIVNVA
jgi:hypothetical protein